MSGISQRENLFFIIEEGQFNLGSFEKAKQMIEMAALAGTDAIEFQLAYADDFYISTEAGHEIYKKREFSDQQLKDLVDLAHSLNIQFVATCLSHKLIDKMALFGADLFNVNASDINNPMIVDGIISTGLPFLVSMPLATLDEVDWVVKRILTANVNADFALLHGQHPMASGKEFVELEDTSLGFIKTAREKYNLPVGFIDHTPLYWMPAVAAAAGAKIISKHMTASHMYQGPDHAICLDPSEMYKAIKLARQAYKSSVVTIKELDTDEYIDRKIMRRSVISARKIAKGEIISIDDIVFNRPGTGISPDQTDSLLGKKAEMDIEMDTVLTFKMFSR